MKKREKIYIIPTGYGLMYGCGVFVSLIGGSIYNNNLAFMLCFFLMALFLIGMVQTHNNIKRINIEKFVVFLSPGDSVGGGMIWIKSENPEKCNQIQVQCRDNDDQFNINIDSIFERSLHSQYFDFKTGSWGKKKIKKIKLSTCYPFGFFYAWRTFSCPGEYFVYPKPIGQLELLPVEKDEWDVRTNRQGRGEDFSEHRRYQVGESHKHIDWKVYARRSLLLTKKFNDGDNRVYLIDYDKTRGSEDKRMAQLSKWIHQCEEKALTYSLKLKTKKLSMSCGERHKSDCLKALAGSREFL